jgi:hypothetical protein
MAALLFTRDLNAFTAGGDTTAPALLSLSFTPRSVDASQDAIVFTFTAHITDDIVGVSTSGTPPQMRFQSPSAGQIVDVVLVGELISGTVVDGIWQSQMTVPRYSEGGLWQAQYLLLADRLGNLRYMSSDDLTALGIYATFTVTSRGDVAPPVLSSFTMAQHALDVSTNEGSITLTLRITDDLSGLSNGGYSSPPQARWASPSGNQIVDAIFTPEKTLVSGDALDGVHIAKLTVPKFAETGVWRLAHLYLTDSSRNFANLTADDVSKLGTTSEFTVTSPGDAAAPQITAYDYSPRRVDIGDSSQSVTFTVHITDDIAGVGGHDMPTQVRFVSPSTSQFFDAVFVVSDGGPVRGRVDVTMTAVVDVSQCSETGVWATEYFLVRDDVGNLAFLDSGELDARGFPTSIEVSNDGRPCTQVAGTAAAGERRLPVASSSAFVAGDVLRINARGNTREDVIVLDSSSMTLHSELRHAHAAGEPVQLVRRNGDRTIYVPMVRR